MFLICSNLQSDEGGRRRRWKKREREEEELENNEGETEEYDEEEVEKEGESVFVVCCTQAKSIPPRLSLLIKLMAGTVEVLDAMF